MVALLVPVFVIGCNTPADEDKGGGEGENVILDWGTGYKTDLFPTNQGDYPGKSVSLSDSQINVIGTLGDISLYSEVIVDAEVYDRDNNSFTGPAIDEGNPFFSLISNNGNWNNSIIVKKWNMTTPEGETSATPATAATWTESGTPTYIVFQGKYISGQPANQMVGYVKIKKITFKPK